MLKSIYVSVLPVLLAALMVWAGLHLQRHGMDWAWLGCLVAAGPALGFFLLVLTTQRIARTDPNLRMVQTASWVGVLMAAYGVIVGQSKPEAAALAAATLIGNYVYIYWYSRFGRRPSEMLLVGKPLPGFKLKDSDGQPFDSDVLRGKPALLLFYRGNWCPLCVAQIKEIAGLYRELAEMGVRVLLISPQSESHSAALAAKFDAPMTFLVDEGSVLATAWGLLAENGTPVAMAPLGYAMDTVLPTALAVDGEGRIIFSDQTDNYRVRPTPETFIKVFRDGAPIS